MYGITTVFTISLKTSTMNSWILCGILLWFKKLIIDGDVILQEETYSDTTPRMFVCCRKKEGTEKNKASNKTEIDDSYKAAIKELLNIDTSDNDK